MLTDFVRTLLTCFDTKGGVFGWDFGLCIISRENCHVGSEQPKRGEIRIVPIYWFVGDDDTDPVLTTNVKPLIRRENVGLLLTTCDYCFVLKMVVVPIAMLYIFQKNKHNMT